MIPFYYYGTVAGLQSAIEQYALTINAQQHASIS